MKRKYKQFNDIIFTNETAAIELPATHCGDPVIKHECIYCCILTDTCNVAYIAYKSGGNLIDWCQLYYLEEFELVYASIQSIVPQYWVQTWIKNGGQPSKSELAVFGKCYTVLPSFL